MKKKVFYTELAYVLGLFFLGICTSFCEKADLGISMIVAPSYLFHLKLSEFSTFFTFGTMEYLVQGFLIILLTILVRKFRLYYLFSFVTAVLSGLLLDLLLFILSPITLATILSRVIFYLIGTVACSFGVALLFKTYIAPGGYELFVKEFALHHNFAIHKVKIVFDWTFFVLAIALSYLFFGRLVGLHVGTIISVLVNGWLIGIFTKILDKHFVFEDALKLRKYMS